MIGLLVYIVLVVLICYLAVWIMGQLAPSHPAIIDNIIWVACVLIIVLILIRAVGVADIPVPRLR